MHRTIRNIATTAVGSLALTASAAAQAVEWRNADGGNGHWYLLKDQPGRQFWQLVSDAQSVGAHLVTIGSSAENEFVRSISIGYWVTLGAIQDHTLPTYAEPLGGWQWVSGEPWTWSGWCAGKPDNANWNGFTGQDLARFNGSSTSCWDDAHSQVQIATWNIESTMFEWDSDCNNDGIVDYGQIRAGQLPDFNGNNIPDCCDQGVPCTIGSYPVQWRASEGGNGHWYQAVTDMASYETQQGMAEFQGGAVVCIADAAENEFVYRFAKARGLPSIWIGLIQDAGASEPSDGWRWTDGSESAWRYWGTGEPNNWQHDEDNCKMVVAEVPDNDYWASRWQDYPAFSLIAAMVEFSSDCNNDGIVDYGQIMSGQLADVNGDGIPDTCQEVVTVPGNFATIQAAIDSTPNGVSRTVNVAAGVYAGPIDFKGKNVVVRGAGAGATILAGSGGATRAVVNMAGEPSTAALERVTVQWGYTGTPFPGTPSALCGGGIFANASSAAIRDCEISDNGAGYGGGAYLLSCTSTIERCTVRANSATGGGGGIQFYGGQNKVIDTVVENNNCTSVGGGIAIVGGLQQIIRTSVRDNTAGLGAGAVWWTAVGQSAQSPAFLTLTNSVLTGNHTTSGPDGGMQLLSDQPNTFVSLTGTQVCGNLPRPNISGRWSDLGGNTVCECVGDVSGDGQVNGADIGVLLSAWGPCGITCPGDLNHDGMINGFDLGLLLANWGPCAP